MPYDNSKILYFFSKFRNEPLEFVMISDINIKNHPNYYKAIFKNLKDNSYYVYPIVPEIMKYKYKVGYIYVNGEYVGKNSTLLTNEFRVNTNSKIALNPISDLISTNEATKK